MATFEDDSSLGILSSAFAAMTGIPLQSGVLSSVETPSKEEIIKLKAKDLCDITVYMFLNKEPVAPLQSVLGPTVTVLMLKSKRQVTLDVSANPSIREIRRVAATQLYMCHTTLMLIYKQKQLKDHQVWADIDPFKRSVTLIFGMKCYSGQRMGMFELDPDSLAPTFDHDFTHEENDGKTYQRGSYEYERPYGWKRYGIKVAGEYEDDVWLGRNAFRTETTPGEWPVSYHGTTQCNVRGIVEQGYWIGKGRRFGSGIYTSPFYKKVAEHYGETFTHDRKRYRVILQNRVNEQCLKVVYPEKTERKDFTYWLTYRQDYREGIFNVRPYGILIKLFEQ